MVASTRRAALGAILAAPLSSVPAISREMPSASPQLLRLIAKHDRINECLRAVEDDEDQRGLSRAAGAIRARVAGFQSKSFADTLAKASCLARMWPLVDAEAEVRRDVASGYVYMDLMALNIAVEVMQLGEGTLCA